MLKFCHRCNRKRNTKFFYRNRCKPDGLTSECKDCTRLRNRRFRQDNPHRAYANNIKWMYGLTEQQFQQLGDCCAICGGTQRLCVDHDHATQEVRGRLCAKCNVGLGMFKDSCELLLRAVEYRKQYSGGARHGAGGDRRTGVSAS